ncbi:hypothetical protein [Hymenobacter properus]|uniref:Carboxypeptidase regulatory-like domain-containing protein n=1 Tax=Hymenobacter properus TaxID=2791026 RepID=A0A931FJH9_9BACT|nr:hypothetical protein [Hymenobacter properus]MBF9140550.1 hypothetical protein [Hymenobacter properus]MBR7719357.1 hypothetical protein [Microvirga sp. SRT04]
MSTPICLSFRSIKLAFLLATGALAGCQGGKVIHILSYEQGQAKAQEYVRHYSPHQKQGKWVGPPVTLNRLRRTNLAADPVITGGVDIQEPDGKLRPFPGALITIDGAHTFADNSSRYARVIGPGRHRLRVGGVGFLWSEAPALHVERGDSIQVIAHLLPEFRPTMN